jgi:diacylglycerol kinase
MSFPAPVYVVALGAAVSAAVAFLTEPGARHLAVALALLLVAGVQPTVTQYNLAALLGMVILVLGAEYSPTSIAAREKRIELEAGTLESRRTLTPAGSMVR